MGSSVFSLSVLVRGLLAVGGVVVFLLCWPVARSAWLFQKTDAFYEKVRDQKPYTLEETQAALATVNAAVAAQPVAFRLVQRSELLGAVAASQTLKVSEEQRRAWQRQAKADLEAGLGNNPARTIDWQRLAIIYEWLDGASRDVPPLLFMAIDTGRMMAPLWPTRVRLILDNWGYLSEEQRTTLSDYMVQMWRLSDDRRFFTRAIYNQIDEAILRYVLRGEPGAQEELTKWLSSERRK